MPVNNRNEASTSAAQKKALILFHSFSASFFSSFWSNTCLPKAKRCTGQHIRAVFFRWLFLAPNFYFSMIIPNWKLNFMWRHADFNCLNWMISFVSENFCWNFIFTSKNFCTFPRIYCNFSFYHIPDFSFKISYFICYEIDTTETLGTLI